MNYRPDDLRGLVAGEVRAHLARRDLTGRDAAAQLGWTQPYISRRLTGAVAFDVTDLEALATLLKIPVTVFFEDPHRDVRTPGFFRALAVAA